MNDLISIIVPVYKVEEYICECIESIINQTYKNLEIILVDDGSPDKCPEICDTWAKKDNRIKVIHKQNGGLSDARNTGIEIATGDYIAFVDSDDWIMPEMYEKMLHTLKNEKADICACNILACYPDENVVCGNNDYFVGNSEQTLDLLYSDTKYPVSAWNKLYKRKCWDNLRFPVGKICEDAFTTYLLLHNAKCIIQIPEALYCYRIRSNSIMTSDFSIKRMDEEEAWRVNYQFIKKHYPRLFNKSFSFYIQKVHVLIKTITKEKQQEYPQQYNYLKNILKKNILFVIFKSRLNLKYKINFIYDYLQL